ncbi:MAG TPA: hypothetical protein VNU70_07335 [Puia sp.]|nr:hypothetical protein [Puia sp.]
MTYLRHPFHVTLTIFLMMAICLRGTGVLPAQRPTGGDNKAHCCTGKFFLQLDKRYDLKPAVFLSTPSFQLVTPPSRKLNRTYQLAPGPVAALVRPAWLRAPPAI